MRVPAKAALLMCVIGLAMAGPAAVAHDQGVTEQPDSAHQARCYEVFPSVQVPFDKARALVPDKYSVDRDPNDMATLLVALRRCTHFRVRDRVANEVIDSYIAVFLDAHDGYVKEHPPPNQSFLQPVLDRETAAIDTLPLELYLIQWISTSHLQTTWLRQATGLGGKARLVPDLVFDYNPSPGHMPGGVEVGFAFSAPTPAPSIFEVSALVAEPQERFDVGINLWADTDEGTLIIFGEHHRGPDQRFGPAQGTMTSGDSRSPLGQMFAGQHERRFDGLSGYFDDGRWTKCLRAAGDECAPRGS